MSISLRPPCFFGDFTDQDSECLPCETGISPPVPTAKIVIFQTNALLVIFFLRVAHICSVCRRFYQGIMKERVPTSPIPLVGSGKPYRKMKKSSPRPMI